MSPAWIEQGWGRFSRNGEDQTMDSGQSTYCEWDQWFGEILDDKDRSYWLKYAIRALIARNPREAFNDAVLLSQIMETRADLPVSSDLRRIVTELDNAGDESAPPPSQRHASIDGECIRD